MWMVNLHSTSMGINLNKDIISESTFDFINFSIRDYVAGICKQNPKKCWPFGSLGDPNSNEFFTSYESAESTVLSWDKGPCDIICSDHTPEHTEAPNLSNKEIINIEEDQPKNTTDMVESLTVNNNMVKDLYDGSSGLTSSKINNGHENSVYEGPKNGRSVAADNNKPRTNRPIIKHQKIRLLIDIYKDPESHELHAPREETNHENVNKTFTAETEGELSNDVTFDEIFRKRKGVEVTDLKIKKKRRMVQIEQPRVDQGKKSKRGFKEKIGDDLEADSGIHSRKTLRTDDKENAFQKQKLPCDQKLNRTEATKSPNEDSEIEAVILLACRFNKEDSSANGNILREIEPDAGRTCVQQNILKRSQKILKCSAPSGNNSIKKTSSTVTKSQVVSADVHKKFTKEKVESVFFSVQMDDDHSKGTTTAGPEPNAKNCDTLVCSLNMNPAEFSFPDDDNEFMRD